MHSTRFHKAVHAGQISRRELLAAGAAGAAAWLSDVPTFLLRESRAFASHRGAGTDVWLEATIPQLQALMASGRLTSQELTLAYLHRIGDLNPLLGAVIETNPDAMGIASGLDDERRMGHLRGPLHGIPVLLKDNIATADRMQTTAG